ncbi:MAG: protein kinase [Thermoanaerobaculales bacterium]|nr:protein kinase [Thermoanaerobaculales bacterium]
MPDNPTVSGVPTAFEVDGSFSDVPPPPAGWKRYERLEFLGRGGMGQVYRAWDPRLKRLVALKFLNTSSGQSSARFLREAQSQASISHPNVCEVFEVGEVAGRFYIAMQLIDGPSLSTNEQQLDLGEKVAIMRDVALATHAAHTRGLIHRDIKPSNVMLEVRDHRSHAVKVVDFGLSRPLDRPGGEGAAPDALQESRPDLTALGLVTGTPSFMAPEQALGANEQLDARTDVYGIGATLYTLLVGKPPFTGSNRAELLLRVVTEAPRMPRPIEPEIPFDLEAIVMKCLAKEPSRRYQSAHDLAEDLAAFLTGDPVAAVPASVVYRLRKAAKKHRALFGLGGAAAVVVLVIAGMLIHTRWSANRQTETALQFGLLVDRVENTLWRVRSLPLHDVRPARAHVTTMLDTIRCEMGELGNLAVGPGNVALGRGFLALGQYKQAREHLERAWTSGYRPPEAAYALGLTLGRLYQEALIALAQAGSEGERKQRRIEAEKSLRDPALDLLRALPASVIEAPEYVEALIARYERRYEDALTKAREASERVEWLYEAHILEGQVLTAIADDHRQAGRYDHARQSLDAANGAYQKAIRVGESDVRAYEGQCSMWFVAWHTEVVHHHNADLATLERLVESCENGLVANRDIARLHELIAIAYSVLADYRITHREDPADAALAASAAADAALAIDSGSIFALTSKATALWHRGQYQMIRNDDPTETFSTAIDAAERALGLDPRSARAHATLAIILTDQAIWEHAQGVDPRPWLQRSVAASTAAAEIDPDSPSNYVNAGIAYRRWMEYLVHTLDEDPSSIAEKAHAVIDRALVLNTEFWWSHRVKGASHTLVAEWTATHGQDPTTEVAHALASLQRSLKLNPRNPRAYAYLGRAYVARAWFEIESICSPFETIRLAENAWSRGTEISPNNGDLKDLRHRLDTLIAEDRSRQFH